MDISRFVKSCGNVFIPEVKKHQPATGKSGDVLLMIVNAPIHPSHLSLWSLWACEHRVLTFVSECNFSPPTDEPSGPKDPVQLLSFKRIRELVARQCTFSEAKERTYFFMLTYSTVLLIYCRFLWSFYPVYTFILNLLFAQLSYLTLVRFSENNRLSEMRTIRIPWSHINLDNRCSAANAFKIYLIQYILHEFSHETWYTVFIIVRKC